MSHTIGATRYNSIDDARIALVVPTPWRAFIAYLMTDATTVSTCDMDPEETVDESWAIRALARHLKEYDTPLAPSQRTLAAYEKMTTAFERTTGLTLELDFAEGDAENGSDLNDEPVWSLGGVYTLSPEAEAFQQKWGGFAEEWHIR